MTQQNTDGVDSVAESLALERQRRLVATLPQTAEQVARLTPCAAVTGSGSEPVHCGHCGQTVTPGGKCAYGVDAIAQPRKDTPAA
jgi:hypothetical protein